MLCITESTFSIPDSNPEFRMGGSYTPGCAASSSSFLRINFQLWNITYPEVPSFVRRTEFFYRVPRMIIKSVNITVFPHLYKFKILLLLKTLRKNCSIQQTLYTEVMG
jgi:hypothetical protein